MPIILGPIFDQRKMRLLKTIQGLPGSGLVQVHDEEHVLIGYDAAS